MMGELRLVSVDANLPVRHRITDGDHLIGRTSDADIVVPDPSVSRRHARLRRRGQQLAVIDLKSSNGTFVNGRRIDGQIGIQPGDVLHVGLVELRVQPEADVAAGPPADTAIAAIADLRRAMGVLEPFDRAVAEQMVDDLEADLRRGATDTAASRLGWLTDWLTDTGGVAAAGAALVDPLVRIARLLGPAAASVVRQLPI